MGLIKKGIGCAVVLAGGFLLMGACVALVVSNHPQGDTGSVPPSGQATSETTRAARPAPTDAQVKDAFETYIKERATSGVMLAQSVTSVAVADGVVTVIVDAKPAVLELSPFNNLAQLFGTPAAFNDDQGIWLRQTVQRVAVFDAGGNSLGSMTAAELNKMGAG